MIVLCNVICCSPPAQDGPHWPRLHPHQFRQPLDIQITRAISEQAREKYHGRQRGSPDQFPAHHGCDRRAGIGARRAFAVFVLAAHPERQRQEKHDPPDDEVDREPGGYAVDHAVQACSISTSAPEKSFGCRNNTGLPWAPIFGTPSPSTRAPCLIRMSRAAMMSGTS